MSNSLTSRIRRLIDDLRPGVSPTLIWTNPLGGQTWRLEHADPAQAQFFKVATTAAPASHQPNLEADRHDWVGDRLPVPRVLDAGITDELSWMVTARLPGTPASDPRWNAQPDRLAAELGRAIRTFHDQLASSVNSCPWSWRIDHRLTHGNGTDAAREMARADAPPEVDLVVSHGDLCAPNILLHSDLSLAGITDLGKLGVAARAADLGCQRWSLEFNGMADQVDTFLDAYGYNGDRDEVRWYRDFYTVV